MKKLFFILIGVVTCVLLCGFDWPKQTPSELRSEMLSCAQAIVEDYPGTPVAKTLKRFIRSQKRDSDPYRWIEATLRLTDHLKRRYPPAPENEAIRRRILSLIDYPLHINNFDSEAAPELLDAYYHAVQWYLITGKNDLFKWLAKDQPQGLAVWKVYNMGYILRTENTTVGIDITDRMSLSEGYAAWSEADWKALAARLDLLLLTHPHTDHYSESLMRAMEDAGKPVVVPCDFPFLSSEMVVDSSLTEPVSLAGVEFVAYVGNQGEGIPNLLYLLDIDGHRVAHNGDNYDRTCEAMLRHSPAVELILGSSWNEIQLLLSEAMAAPGADNVHQVFIPGHENELCHTVNHRESYRELFTREDRLGSATFSYPKTVVIDAGEWYALP